MVSVRIQKSISNRIFHGLRVGKFFRFGSMRQVHKSLASMRFGDVSQYLQSCFSWNNGFVHNDVILSEGSVARMFFLFMYIKTIRFSKNAVDYLHRYQMSNLIYAISVASSKSKSKFHNYVYRHNFN